MSGSKQRKTSLKCRKGKIKGETPALNESFDP
jgi:hypothetical protein